MKKLVLSASLVMLVLLTTADTHAQKKQAMPEYATWQIVSNINDKSKVTVQFFTLNGTLMYEETLHNIKLDVTKKKTVRRLNEVLKQVHEAWVKKLPTQHHPALPTHLLATRFD
jgi:hypothetical protein